MSEKDRRRYDADREKERARSRAWRAANPEKYRAAVASWKARNPDKVKQYDRTKRGIKGAELFSVILMAQGGMCGICKASSPGGRGGWHADHDHTSGQLRGVLCALCNVGLGHFRDTPELLEAAAAYLRTRNKDTK